MELAIPQEWRAPSSVSPPGSRYIARQARRHLVTMVLVLVLLPLLFLDQDLTTELPIDQSTLTPRALPPLTVEEAVANDTVLSYRACPAGPSLVELIDESLMLGRVGMIHGRAGSQVNHPAGNSTEYDVDVVIETLASGVAGPPSRSEGSIRFRYDARSGQVTARDSSGASYLYALRRECTRELSPFRRGPPQSVAMD